VSCKYLVGGNFLSDITHVTSAACICTTDTIITALAFGEQGRSNCSWCRPFVSHLLCVAAERAQLRSKRAAFFVVLTACIVLAASFYGTMLLAWA
jgi:hypothetical protein